MEIYIVIKWQYDGDNYLYGLYETIFTTYDKAISYLNYNTDLVTPTIQVIGLDQNNKEVKELIPDDWGGQYGDYKYEIRKQIIN